MEKSSSYNAMLEKPVRFLILKLSVPTIISMLITSFYNIADTYFIGKISTSASGAVGIVFSFTAIIQACGFFFGHGSGNYISRKLGENNKEEALKMASTGFFSALFTGILIMIVGLIFKKNLSSLLGSTKTILPYTMDYLKFILLGVPFSMSSFVLNNQLRFQGKAFLGMIGIAIGAILNIILDPIFIFTLGLGISGAALATIISQIISFIILFTLYNRKSDLRINIKNVTYKLDYIIEIFRGGIPSLCRQGITSLGLICFNTAAGPFGDEAIAAMSIVSRETFFGLSVMIGFGQGFQPVCGFNYGAKRFDRVKEAFWFCVKLGTLVMFCLSVTGAIFAKQLITLLLKNDPVVTQYGTIALRLQCITFSLNGWITICNMIQQNLGRVFSASFLAMARQGILFIPLVFILPQYFGLFGLFLVQPIADFLTFVISIPLQQRVLKELNTAN